MLWTKCQKICGNKEKSLQKKESFCSRNIDLTNILLRNKRESMLTEMLLNEVVKETDVRVRSGVS